MAYATQILYNGIDPFFPQPTPLIGVDVKGVYYDELWTKTERFTLHGTLTGCDFATITSAQKNLLYSFALNYQNLVVQETDNNILNVIYTKPYCEIQNITFAQSLWRGVLPYTITMESYPSGFFSGAYGIIDPVDRWEYIQNKDNSLDVTHTVSAQGLSLSTGQTLALNNVTTWVRGRTGFANAVNPLFILNSNTGSFCQITIEENINRLDGIYTIIERYVNDLTRPGYGILRYTTDISSGYNLINVNVNGTIEGGNRDITDLRKVFTGFSIYGAASNAYSQLMQETDLNPYPLTQKVEEDIIDSRISFAYSFDNDPSPQTQFDYDVTLTSGNNIEVAIEGTVHVRGGDIVQKYTNAVDYAGTLNLYQLAVPFYNSFYPYANPFNGHQAHPLNPIPVTSGMRVSRTNQEISMFATFTNQDKVSPYLDIFKYTISVTPPVEQLDFKAEVDILGLNNKIGNYSIVDLGYSNRTSFNINGNALINESANNALGLQAIKSACTNILQTYGNMVNVTLDIEEIEYPRYDDKLVSFNFTWSFEGKGFTVASFPYTTISSLKVSNTPLPQQ